MLEKAFVAGPPALAETCFPRPTCRRSLKEYRALSIRKQHRILCVSVSPMNLRAFQCVLRSADYQVVSALSPDQAVAFCVNNAVAAIVLDSEFLTEQGWSVAQTFKSLCPKVPILLCVEDRRRIEIPLAVDALADTPATLLQELKHIVEHPPDRAAASLAG